MGFVSFGQNSVKWQVGSRTVTLDGDLDPLGSNQYRYVIDRDTIDSWYPPFDHERIDEAIKATILTEAVDHISKMPGVVRVELKNMNSA